jgi:hypothetical protein
MVTIHKRKNSNSQEKEQQQQQQLQTFIMFTTRQTGDYYSLKERYHRFNHQQEQQLPLYHLSYRFNAETFRTRSLCNIVYWIDWGTPFEILTIDKIAAVIIQNKQEGIARRLICERCVLRLAPLLTEQEQAEISRIYDDDKKEISSRTLQKKLQQSKHSARY